MIVVSELDAISNVGAEAARISALAKALAASHEAAFQPNDVQDAEGDGLGNPNRDASFESAQSEARNLFNTHDLRSGIVLEELVDQVGIGQSSQCGLTVGECLTLCTEAAGRCE